MAAYTYICPKCNTTRVCVHNRYEPPILRCAYCLTLLKRAIPK